MFACNGEQYVNTMKLADDECGSPSIKFSGDYRASADQSFLRVDDGKSEPGSHAGLHEGPEL